MDIAAGIIGLLTVIQHTRYAFLSLKCEKERLFNPDLIFLLLYRQIAFTISVYVPAIINETGYWHQWTSMDVMRGE